MISIGIVCLDELNYAHIWQVLTHDLLENTLIDDITILTIFCSIIIYKTNRFHNAMVLYNNKSQLDDIKYGKNISETLGCILSATFLILTKFYHHLWSSTEQTCRNMEALC